MPSHVLGLRDLNFLLLPKEEAPAFLTCLSRCGAEEKGTYWLESVVGLMWLKGVHNRTSKWESDSLLDRYKVIRVIKC